MPTAPAITRFAGLARWQAIMTLALWLALLAAIILAALTSKRPAPPPGRGGSDLQLYRAIITRVHNGENYYNAAGAELRAQGYPTGSLFNWRPPLYAWLIGRLPSPVWAQAILGLFALVTLIWAFRAIHRESGPAGAIAAALLMVGAFYWCLDGEAYLAQELWAGVLIAFSVAAYGLGRWPWGVAAGVAALFLRELALPYCLLTVVLAWRDRRRLEAAIWVGGFALYGLFLAYHGMEVARRMSPADRLPASWIQFGGVPFVLSTCRMNEWLFKLPTWITAIYLWLALVGFTGWSSSIGVRSALTATGYMAAFAVVGQRFNEYWGLLYAPLLPFGIVWAPAAFRDLCRNIVAASWLSGVATSAPANLQAAQPSL